MDFASQSHKLGVVGSSPTVAIMGCQNQFNRWSNPDKRCKHCPWKDGCPKYLKYYRRK